MKHTKGPWIAKGFSVTKSNGFKITQQRPAGAGDWEGVDRIWEADAKIIAAAPELLEACIDLKARLSLAYGLDRADMEVMEHAQAIIDKATK